MQILRDERGHGWYVRDGNGCMLQEAEYKSGPGVTDLNVLKNVVDRYALVDRTHMLIFVSFREHTRFFSYE